MAVLHVAGRCNYWAKRKKIKAHLRPNKLKQIKTPRAHKKRINFIPEFLLRQYGIMTSSKQEPHNTNTSILAKNGLLCSENSDGVLANDNTSKYIDIVTTSDGSTTYQCAMCMYSNVHQWKVANHIRSFHVMTKMFRCTKCNFSTERKVEFCLHRTQCKGVHKTDDVNTLNSGRTPG